MTDSTRLLLARIHSQISSCLPRNSENRTVNEIEEVYFK